VADHDRADRLRKHPTRRYRPEAIDRLAHARRATELFNAGRFWDAHEELEVIWRSVPDESEARVLQGLIQAAAALLHRERDNQHGVRVVGGAALEKLAGEQHPAIEFETVGFRTTLEKAFARGGPPPTLRLRTS
jgi:hypothetical protein